MTEIQKLSIRRSEIRQRLNELGSKSSLTDTEVQEVDKLSAEYQVAEVRHRALAISEDEKKTETREDTTGEGAELRALERRANLGSIVESVVEHFATKGAERELQQAHKLAGNQFPVSLLETRAAASAAAPPDVQGNQQSISPVVFPRSVTAFLGVEQPVVPTGQPVYPIMVAPSTHISSVDEGATVDDETGTFTASILTPRRIQRSITYSREDAAVFPGMDDAIRGNLSDAITGSLDFMALRTATTGLLTHGTAPTTPSAVATFADYRGAVFAAVDGRYAGRPRKYSHASRIKHAYSYGHYLPNRQ